MRKKIKIYIEIIYLKFNKNGLDNPDIPVFTSSNLTNLGVFRFYAEAYLRNHEFVDPTQPVILRHRTPDGNGLPLQVYVFTKNNQFIPYDQLFIIQEQAKAMGYVKNNPNTFKITIKSTPVN